VWLSLADEDGVLRVEVRDDGVGGADPDAANDRTGLRGLRDRVEALEGWLDVESPAGAGTRLVACIPAKHL
jgi:signal transduction histidine kinase